MKKIYLLYLLIVFTSIVLVACSHEIDSIETSEISSTTTETTTGETTEITVTTEVTTSEEITLVEPGQRDYEYEKDIVFVGDSLCKGLRVYPGYLDETQVFAEGSVASWNFFDYKFVINGGEYTGVEAIKRCQPKYIYIWLGMNDARWTSKEAYVTNLKKISDAFLEVSPHSKIIIVSITPVCSFHKWYDDYANGVTKEDPNVQINELNEYTQEYFEGLDDTYSYLNIHDLLVDSEGYLNEEYHSGDGLHINPKAYDIIMGAIAQNKVQADPEHIAVTTSFPYIETAPPETTTATEETLETTEETEETVSAEVQTEAEEAET